MGEPVGQGRPKFTTHGRFVHAYDPPKSRLYKAKVARAARRVCKAPYTKPVKVTLDIYRPIQKSGSKALRAAKAAGDVLPVVKPDIDNVFKAVTDAVKGIAWVDDNQICVAVISKRYSDTPRIEMKIEEIKTNEH
ncbi:RusA family crossover junction endodeoxyribonuclease [Lacticaseibacillus songhuajiangensis]|uniref:RusA family crossover junction endodeoxyribonuclease n=1 Tax=Lacticaseibacillus songhuajiangensis TaxID=1296539 RepID=UPI002989EA53|nr:RusA family crossover junction endodeoxyribonuclease [Lacticaseibacillus songhuajiangensis]